MDFPNPTREEHDLSPDDVNAHSIECLGPFSPRAGTPGDRSTPLNPRNLATSEHESDVSPPPDTTPRWSNIKILPSSLFQEVGLNTFRPGPNVKLGSQPFQYRPVVYNSEDAKSAMLGGWFHRLFQNKPPLSLNAPPPEFSSFFELLRGTLHEFPIIGEDEYQPMTGKCIILLSLCICSLLLISFYFFLVLPPGARHPLILVYAYAQFVDTSSRKSARKSRRVFALADLESTEWKVSSSIICPGKTMMLVLGDECHLQRVLANMIALGEGKFPEMVRVSQEDPYLTHKSLSRKQISDKQPTFKVNHMTVNETALRHRIQKLFLMGLLPFVFVNTSFVVELALITSDGRSLSVSPFCRDPRTYLHYSGTRLSFDAHRDLLLNHSKVRGTSRFTSHEVASLKRIPSHHFNWFIGSPPAIKYENLNAVSSIDLLNLPAVANLPLNFSITDKL